MVAHEPLATARFAGDVLLTLASGSAPKAIPRRRAIRDYRFARREWLH